MDSSLKKLRESFFYSFCTAYGKPDGKKKSVMQLLSTIWNLFFVAS